MKDLFKLSFFKRKINLARFFCFCVFCQGIFLYLKTMLDEIRKASLIIFLLHCYETKTKTKNIRTGGASYQGKPNLCTIRSHPKFVPKYNQNKKGAYSVRSHPSFHSMNPFITPKKKYKSTNFPVSQTAPMERETAGFFFMFFIC